MMKERVSKLRYPNTTFLHCLTMMEKMNDNAMH